MNPLTNVKNINKLNEQELKLGISNSCSWHKIYKHSPWIFIGGLDYDLTEGDVICVFSQYGEIEEINLVRDKKTGKSKGFCFLCYQNKTSTTLAVDNFNGIKLCGRTIRVDHVANYRTPKEDKSEETKEPEDPTAFLEPLLQTTLEDDKPRYKHKEHKESSTEQSSKGKHYHKSTKNNVPKEVAVDSEKSHRHHHQAKEDSLKEKSHKISFNRHSDKDIYKHRKTERHSSSDESIKAKHKPKKTKHKIDRKKRYSDSSSDESSERVKHKSKHKHKKHKRKESRH